MQQSVKATQQIYETILTHPTLAQGEKTSLQAGKQGHQGHSIGNNLSFTIHIHAYPLFSRDLEAT